MARPIKQGLDYFPLDVDIDSDDKTAMIEALHGIEGFGIVIKLLMKIYKEGYFYEWNKREQILFSKRVNVDINQVIDVVNDCINEGMFNKDMYEQHKILTSKGIQKRYLEAIKRRKEVVFDAKYYLIDDIKPIVGTSNLSVFLVDEDNNRVNVNINSINDNISTQRKGKQNREKEIDNKELKVKKPKTPKKQTPKIKFAEFVSMTEDEHKKLVIEHGMESVDEMIKVLDNYKGANGKTYKSDYRAILTWVIDRVKPKSNANGKPSGNAQSIFDEFKNMED